MSAQASQNNITIQTHNIVGDDMVEISTSAVSVIARIDYIQRFSKQMTVVVDSDPAVYSKVARQYLANVSQDSSKQEINVAFVAASNKINDIQMRCRLIEQLFANTLFDPEQSLAVSVLRLAEQNNGMITVIVEHAHALSLQIKYELCQLVDTAKKTQNNINVVIFGLEQTATEIAQNKSIFDKKTSVVDASSGQVFALEHAKFKVKPAELKKDVWLKVSLISLSSVLIVILAWFLLSEHQSFNFANIPAKPPVIEQPKVVLKEVEITTLQAPLASVSDVHLALLGQDVKQQTVTAESDDILQALMIAETAIGDNHTIVTPDEELAPISKAIQTTLEPVNTNDVKKAKLTDVPVVLNEQYYLNAEKGYVVQIKGFSDLSALQTFVEQNNGQEYFSYQKSLNTQKFFALTTKIFSDKAQAKEAMSKLPQNIIELGAFLKSVSTIKREINTVSQ